jgi:hypothetical protein
LEENYTYPPPPIPPPTPPPVNSSIKQLTESIEARERKKNKTQYVQPTMVEVR